MSGEDPLKHRLRIFTMCFEAIKMIWAENCTILLGKGVNLKSDTCTCIPL